MFRVKICGVMTAADARMVAESGADAIGLNFVTGSPRFLDTASARIVAAGVPEGVLRVGVFAGATALEILHIAEEVGLDAIQLHGHIAASPADQTLLYDPPELCIELAGLPVIRAVRLESDGLTAARLWLVAAAAAGRAPVMALVDASVSRGTVLSQLGGTGARVDWEALASAGTLSVPMALAGGLTPDNVAEAMRRTGLLAVDTASGVESAVGCKDPHKVRAFVAAAASSR